MALRDADSRRRRAQHRAHRRRAGLLRRRRPVRIQGSDARQGASGGEPRRADDERCTACSRACPSRSSPPSTARPWAAAPGSRSPATSRVMASTAQARLSGGEARHRRRDRAWPIWCAMSAARPPSSWSRPASRSMPRAPGARDGQSRHRAREADGRRLRLAEKFASVPRPAMAATKQLFYRVVDLPFEQALEEGRDINKRMRAFRKS